MISLTFTVDNIGNVTSLFDKIQIRKLNYPVNNTPDTPVTNAMAMAQYSLVSSGIDTIGCQTGSERTNVSDIELCSSYSQYYFTDPQGNHYDWYISRYYSSVDGSTSGWADPVLGESGDIFYDPRYPEEVEYGSEDQQLIDRIRRYIGDPKGLRREYGEDAASSIHLDGKTYEMDEKGWPAMVNMGGIPYTSTDNPSVNGYRFLRFQNYIDVTNVTTVWSGCDYDTYTHGVDIWYYTFRHSDRQIMAAYDNCPIPAGLTAANVTIEAYVLQTAINLATQELFEDSVEDGATVTDETTRYSPDVGLKIRAELLDKLIDKLDKLIRSLVLRRITGVLID